MPQPMIEVAPDPHVRRGARRGHALGVWEMLAVLVAAGVIASLAVFRLRSYPYPLDVRAAVEGARSVMQWTAPAALASWAVLALVLTAIAIWLRPRAGDLSVGELVAGAVVLFWSGCYGALLVLGPFGAYRPVVLRAILGAVVLAALAFSRPTARRDERTTSHGRPGPSKAPRSARGSRGAWISVGAFALVVGPLLLMQLGSPVSPFMDVLPYIASAQKIVTFRFYDPFANDAAGLWGASRQVVGCDAPFSFFPLVTGVPAHLAITSLMVPLAALQLLAIYLCGRHVYGGAAGGMAALFLLQTFLWRRTPDARGTALAFSLVAIGIAFL